MASYGIACLLLFGTIPLVNGDGCNASLAVTSSSATQSAKTGSGLCTWTFETQEPKSLVSLEIVNVSLSVGPPCTTNNSIVIYDGDLTGPIMGIVCESYMKIVSVHNTIVLQYSADLVKTEDSFSVMFNSIPESHCGYQPVDVTSYSPNEYSLFSPGYSGGITGPYPSCGWVIRPYTSGRTGVSVETGANTTTTCQEAELSFLTKLDTKKHATYENMTWCPGKPNVFQSWNGHILNLIMNIHSENSVMVKYRELKASTCLGQYIATNKRQALTTTNFPNPYPSFEECRWHINATELPSGMSIRIDVVYSGMEPSENCYTDVFKVYGKDVPPDVFDVLAGEMCDNGTRSFYLYIPSALLIFRSWRENVKSKGINVTYGLAEVEQCGGNFTAKTSPQQIKSPGYPVAFPRHHSCQYTMTVEDPLQYVQVRFLDTHLTPYAVTGVQVVDGILPSGYVLGRVNVEQTPTFEGAEESISLQFSTGLYQDKGFLLEYKQVKDHFPLRRFWSPDFLKGKFSSPKYPYGKVRDMDAVWTISSINDYNHFLLAFETVDLGDEKNCSDNFITVYNGNMSDSGTRKTTLCGKERGAFLAQGRFLTVVFKTDNTTAKKGFVANYTNDHFEGCTGTVKVVSIYDSSHIQTPNYPYMYPRNMNCSYQLVAIEQSELLSLKIEEMGMGDSNCQKDYVEIFDGPSPSSKSLGRYCGDKMGTVSSSGKQMFVRFVSGRKGGGIGCKINIDTVNNDKTPLIIGLSTGGAFLGFLLMLALIVFIERRRQKRSGNALL